MTETLLLALSVLATAAVWPLDRWAFRHGGTPVGTGIVLSVVTLAAGIVGSVATGQPIYHPAAFFFGALGGIAYAVGFVLIILQCLATGPLGPTAAASTLGLAGTALATLLVPYAPVTPGVLYAGLALSVLAVVLLGAAPVERGKRRTDYSVLIVAGWAFVSLASATQFLSGRFAPQAPFGYLVAQALVSLLLLLIVASTRTGSWPRAADLLAGIGTGIVPAVLVPLSATSMSGMNAAAVYPVTVAAPVLLVAALGGFVFRERLTVWGWIACAAGIAALVLMSLPRM
jgi:hypothetical protein